MSTVHKIESEIKKLSMDEQRVIARHLDERLFDEKTQAGKSGADEGIRFLPRYEAGFEFAAPLRFKSRSKSAC